MQKKCKQECIVVSRVVGFYSNVHEWNPGKLEEYKMRKTVDINNLQYDEEEEKKDEYVEQEMSAFTA